jgi:transglutaminase-like putative cysteine protease
MKRAVPIFSCAALSMLAAMAIASAAGPEFPSDPSPVIRQIRYSFTLRNTTNHTLRHVDFWTYAPVPKNSIQQCVNLEVSSPYRLLTDDIGNQVLHVALADLPPYATRIFSINARVSFSEKLTPIPAGDLRSYLQAEKQIESDDPDIRRTAAVLKETSPLRTAERIFRWVSGHIRDYEYSGEERGALFAFRNRRGDCSEAMHLFIALCRVNGIPARGIGGYVQDGSAILDPDTYHHWAEFYAEGAWHVADPQRKVFRAGQSRYCALRIIGRTTGNPMENHHRFRFTGEGLEVRMNRG